jgi:hypothetical protein
MQVWLGGALPVEDKGMPRDDEAGPALYIINKDRANTLAAAKHGAYHMCRRCSGGASRVKGT